MQVQKKHFRSWLRGVRTWLRGGGGFDRTSRTPSGYGHEFLQTCMPVIYQFCELLVWSLFLWNEFVIQIFATNVYLNWDFLEKAIIFLSQKNNWLKLYIGKNIPLPKVTAWYVEACQWPSGQRRAQSWAGGPRFKSRDYQLSN